MIPACWNAAWYTAKLPAREPVCDDAAFCPIADDPDFIAITGFAAVIRRTISRKRRPFLISST